MQLLCPAKINLFLHVLNKRKDGYHNIQTILQRIEWFDALKIQLNHSGRFTAHVVGENIAPQENILYRVWKFLKQKNTLKPNVGCSVSLQKNIPLGTGLGGASSNAATFLMALNKTLELKLNTKQLSEIALKIGCDVPFFLQQKSVWAQGVGERFTDLHIPAYHYVLIWQNEACLTTNMFKNLQVIARKTRSIQEWNLQHLHFKNDFESMVCKQNTNVKMALHWLKNNTNSHRVSMTGSGSCVFAAFTNQHHAQLAFQSAPFQNKKVTKGIVEFKALTAQGF